MQKTIPTIFLVLAVLFATAGTSWGQEVTMRDLVKREGLYYQKFTDVPFTGVTTGLSQYTIKNGILHGPRVVYWSNGQLWLKGNYRDGKVHGPWVTYHENGQLMDKGNHINGKQDGPWISYHDNGQLFWKGNYINGQEDGPWVFYDQDGVLNTRLSGTYRNGVKVSD